MYETCFIELLLPFLFSTITVTYTLTILIKVFKDKTTCKSKVPSQICTAATEAKNLFCKYNLMPGGSRGPLVSIYLFIYIDCL